MSIYRRCTALIGAPGGAAFGSGLHGKSHKQRKAHEVELQVRENEAGTLAASVEASDGHVTTGSV